MSSAAATGQHISRNIILSKTMRLSMDTRKTRRNCNILVIGGAGAGKSRFFVKPNLCEMPLNTSFIVTDPSGELIAETGTMLEMFGYKVKCLNLEEMSKSYHYNPLKYVHTENDIIALSDVILNNTKEKDSSGGEPFWEQAQALMIRAFISLLVYHGEELRLPVTITTFMDLMRWCQAPDDAREAKAMGQDKTDMLFSAVKDKGWWFDPDELDENGNEVFKLGKPSDPAKMSLYHEPYGDTITSKFYNGFRQGAGKTLKSILISGIARLSALESQEIIELLSTDDIELDKLGDEKTALFIVIPQAHASFNFIAAMMYSQLFSSLYYHAEQECQGNYLVCDSCGEITKIFPIDHEAKAPSIDYSNITQTEITNRKDLMPEKKSKIKVRKPNKDSNARKFDPDIDSGTPDEDGNVKELDDEKDLPQENTLDDDKAVEQRAKDYCELIKHNTKIFQWGELFLLKCPDKDGMLDSTHGEVIGTYRDYDNAKKKQQRITNCTIRRCGLYLPFHVSFYLDEFANIGVIPNFDKIIATSRKYEISEVIIVQGLSQLKGMYKDDYETLIGNCDTILFLGSSAVDTTEYISKKLGKATLKIRSHSESRGSHPSHSLSSQYMGRELMMPDELSLMSDTECLVMIRGVNPFRGPKHTFTNHRNYKYTADAGAPKYEIIPPKKTVKLQKVSFSSLTGSEIKEKMEQNNFTLDDITESTKEVLANYENDFNKQKAELDKEIIDSIAQSLSKAKPNDFSQLQFNDVSNVSESDYSEEGALGMSIFPKNDVLATLLLNIKNDTEAEDEEDTSMNNFESTSNPFDVDSSTK